MAKEFINTTWLPIYDFVDEVKDCLTYKIGIGIHTYYLPIIAPLGFVFNIISLWVMLQPANRKISCCIYLAALAITDNVVLYVTIYYWLTSVVFRNMTTKHCQSLTGLFQMFSVSSSYLIVSVTVDRFLATCFPLTTMKWRTPKRAYIVTGLVILICIICNIPMIPSASMADSYTCVALSKGQDYVKTYSIISAFLFTVMPFAIILTLNMAISRKMKKRERSMVLRYGINAQSSPGGPRHTQTLSVSDLASSYSSTASDIATPNADSEAEQAEQDFQESSDHDPTILPTFSRSRHGSVCRLFHRIRRGRSGSNAETSNGSLDRQLAKMLLTVSFTFMVLTLPQYIRYIVFGFVDHLSTPKKFAAYILVVNITNKLATTNSAVNFILYCISGRRFRKHLRLMIERRKCCVKSVILTGEPLGQ